MDFFIDKIADNIVGRKIDQKERDTVIDCLLEGKKLPPELKPKTTEELENELKTTLFETYERIIRVLKHYSDIREDYYELVAVWIIGTYVYKQFETYPYLFINAMRGSGKTRLLKLIKSMARNAEMVTSLREAVLFRTAHEHTLCIDEFESIHKKENSGLRELLNACYKKGMKVKRMKKVKTPIGEEQKVEEFEPYTCIAMANIWGMEEVLGDRCITMILEKSRGERVSRLVEDFDNILEINMVKNALNSILVYLCSYISVKGYINYWNSYVNNRLTYTHTLTTLTTQTTQTTLEKIRMDNIFNKIWDTGINGRHLELMFPLIIIADIISPEVFEKILKIATELTKEKNEEEMIESRDVSLIDYISKLSQMEDFYGIKELTYSFREYIGDDEDDDRWLNPKWAGKAIRRLGLVIDKRRVGKGVEVRLNINKAKEIMEHFRKTKKQDG